MWELCKELIKRKSCGNTGQTADAGIFIYVGQGGQTAFFLFSFFLVGRMNRIKFGKDCLHIHKPFKNVQGIQVDFLPYSFCTLIWPWNCLWLWNVGNSEVHFFRTFSHKDISWVFLIFLHLFEDVDPYVNINNVPIESEIQSSYLHF